MQTERLNIRFLKQEDFESFFEIVSNKKSADDMAIIPDKLDAQQKFNRMIEQSKAKKRYSLALIHKSNNAFVGFVEIVLTEPECADLSCVIHPNFWNQGYGSEAMLLIEKFSLEKLHLKKLRAVCNSFNPSCTSLFKNVLGFEYLNTQYINGKDYLFFEKRVGSTTKSDTYMQKLEAKFLRQNK